MIARFRLLAKENWTNLYEIVLASSIMNVLRHGMLVVLATDNLCKLRSQLRPANGAQTLSHDSIAGFTAVVECTKEPIQNHQTATVVAFEMFVVKVVKMATALDRKPVAEFYPFEASMRCSRVKDRELDLEQRIHWMQRH